MSDTFYFPATRNPMEFLSCADFPRETAGVANGDLRTAQLFQRLDAAPSRTNPDDWSIATPGTVVAGPMTGVASTHPHSRYRRIMR